MNANTTTTTTTRTMAQVKALFPECFTLSIVDAVAAATDKGAAVDLIARAIVGAALEYGHSGSDSRLKSARDSLMGKGKGAQVRARAVSAIDAIKDSMKPRALGALDDDGIIEWVSTAQVGAIASLTPAPVVRKVKADTGATVTAPEAGATVTAPEAGATGADTGAGATVTAPEAGVTAPAVADIVAAILAGAYDIVALAAISAALREAPGVPVVKKRGRNPHIAAAQRAALAPTAS